MATVSMRLWYVVRSGGRGRRGPQLRYRAVARRTDKMVWLLKPWHDDRIMFRRSDLAGHGLFERPIDALLHFRERSEYALALAKEDVARAERDLAFALHRPASQILRYARDGAE
jgi:hypothetical protein